MMKMSTEYFVGFSSF